MTHRFASAIASSRGNGTRCTYSTLGGILAFADTCIEGFICRHCVRLRSEENYSRYAQLGVAAML